MSFQTSKITGILILSFLFACGTSDGGLVREVIIALPINSYYEYSDDSETIIDSQNIP